MNRNRISTATLILAAMLALAASMSAVHAAETHQGPVRPDWFFHDIVDVQFVMQHVKAPMPENVMIIDARPAKSKYIKGHIPMAVSLPYTQFDKMTDKLPKDKNALLIFYCGGLKCKLSHKSARKAEALGYTNVKVFAAGFPQWMQVPGNYAAVSAEWVKKQIDTGADMVLIDSRPRKTKYNKGHVPSALSIPDSQFEKQTELLPKDKNKLLVFYCGGFKCKLSHKSAAKAISLGYTNVKVFAAGYPAWKQAYGMAQAPPIKRGTEEGSIDIVAFEKIVREKPDSIYLVDVRDADEFAAGSFETAVNIPVEKLEKQITSLPADKPIVFICGTGARSGESFYMLQDLKPELKNVFYLDAELTFRQDGTFFIKKPAS